MCGAILEIYQIDVDNDKTSLKQLVLHITMKNGCVGRRVRLECL